MRDSKKILLEQVEAFLVASGMSATAFGEAVMNDRHLVRRLRSGSDVTLGTVDRMHDFMDKHTPKGARAKLPRMSVVL